MFALGVAVLTALLRLAAAQDANCDFTQRIDPSQTYYIYSPGYPDYYTGGRQCRWIAIAPAGYQNVLQCTEITMPASQGCSMDRLMISRSGDPQLAGADVYCGRGTASVTSTGPRLTVGLITARSTTGGRFYCELRAKPYTPAPTCSCGYKKRNRIVGGQETGVNEYTMMAAVVERSIYSVKCGGAIIDVRYVLTAAHCVLGRAAAELAVVVGEHDINVGDSPATQALNIERITSHPQFSSSNYDYDIAVLRVSRDVVFSDRVGPACLPFKFANTDLTGAPLTFLGWGTLYPGGPTSDTLQKVDVAMVSQSSCQRQIPALTPRQLCTYTPGKDACQDDSGGPGLYTDPATGLLFSIGVISYGRFCASDTPGVSTRVTSLLPWIEANTPGAYYCRK